MIDAGTHAADVDHWRHGRYEVLLRDRSWLTLAGLSWLRRGVNRVGSAPDNDIVLPGGPPHAGTLTVADEGVTAHGHFTHEGAPVRELPLRDDHAPQAEPTLLELDRLQMIVIRRGDRLALRTWDLDARQRRDFTGIDHWPVDAGWRLEARLEPTPGRTLHVPDVLGPGYDETSPGDVVFALGGTEHRLQALPGGPDGSLWLVFGDETNGSQTYAGGRFVYTEAPQADGRVILDFNRAYNPPCVFSPYATCPLPWPDNRLPVRVEAGEMAYRRP